MAWTRRRRFFLAYLAVTAAYTVTGKLAMLLAVSPGYASPVFPPAGIAVAAMLIGGWVTLPWTFLGSLLLNIWIPYGYGAPLNGARVAAASAIAAASMLQAAIGGKVLHSA